MNIAMELKTTTGKEERLISLKYIKKPCHLCDTYMCELIHITEEIGRRIKPRGNPHRKHSFRRQEIHKYYLYIPENVDGEMRLFVESHCLGHKQKNIKTIHEFLVSVSHFLHEARIKDGIQGMEPILAKVEDLIKQETKKTS